MCDIRTLKRIPVLACSNCLAILDESVVFFGSQPITPGSPPLHGQVERHLGRPTSYTCPVCHAAIDCHLQRTSEQASYSEQEDPLAGARGYGAGILVLEHNLSLTHLRMLADASCALKKDPSHHALADLFMAARGFIAFETSKLDGYMADILSGPATACEVRGLVRSSVSRIKLGWSIPPAGLRIRYASPTVPRGHPRTAAVIDGLVAVTGSFEISFCAFASSRTRRSTVKVRTTTNHSRRLMNRYLARLLSPGA